MQLKKKVSITEPYEYEMIGGKKVLMVTVSSPILVDGKINRSCRVDFTLETINKKFLQLVYLKQDIYLYMKPHGIVVAHPRTESIGKIFQI